MTLESQSVEWKEHWRDEHLRWVCGFANGEGGTLVIGRNDSGEVVGVSKAEKLLQDVRDLLGIIVEVNLREAEDKSYLEIAVPAYPSPISYRGHYFQRVGSTLQELKGPSLDRFLLRKQGRTWDSVPVPGVAVSDLDAAAMQRFRKLASASGRLDAEDLRVPDSVLISRLRLTEGDYLKRAAVLLFHEDPERFVTGAFVKIGFFRAEADLVYHDLVQGDLFSQVHQSLDLLLTKYLKAAISYQGIERIERFRPYCPMDGRWKHCWASMHRCRLTRTWQTPFSGRARSKRGDAEFSGSSRPARARARRRRASDTSQTTCGWNSPSRPITWRRLARESRVKRQ